MNVYKAISQLAPNKHFKIIGEDSYSNLVWLAEGEPPTEEEVNAILPDLILNSLKSEKILEIDKKTKQLILAGFEFDSETFSCSEEAQLSLAGMSISSSSFTWPAPISTLDNNQYLLAEEDLPAFALAMGEHIAAAKYSGLQLKVSVNAASDQTELDAVVDNR